ncbi:MAG TPA: hypothetical protein VHF69_04145 [Candidatus Synoicihabitans sp.]|nr:hypothetical protein [Candidatus Synoicihabitans sp.]
MKAQRTHGGDLEISEDFEFQQRSWFWERIGQIAVVGLVLAALIGLFGGGPISIVRQASPDEALRVEHPRFVRNQSPLDLQINVAPSAARDGQVRLWLDTSLTDSLTIDSIMPEPDSTELGTDRVYLSFRVAAGESIAPIKIHATADAIGREGGHVGIREGPSVAVRWWSHP